MNEKKDTFSTFHPVINFTFYIGAFLLGMMLIHPVFLAVSAITAAAFYITVKGRKAKSFLFGMIPLFLISILCLTPTETGFCLPGGTAGPTRWRHLRTEQALLRW